MTANEFINKLCALYREAPFEEIAGKKVRNFRVSEVDGYVKKLAPELLSEFYIEVTTNFIPTASVPFPTPANLSDIWNKMPDKEIESIYTDNQKVAISIGRDMTVKQINDRVDEIRKDGEFTNPECEFISVWEHLATVWGMMWDYKMDTDRIIAYTNRLKDEVCAGRKIDVAAACRSLFGEKKPVNINGMQL